MVPLRPVQFLGLLLASFLVLFVTSSLWPSSSFSSPSLSTSPSIITSPPSKPRPPPAIPHKAKRVAIVGAGASGSSAAFFLSRAAREAGLKDGALEIVVYERNNYIGGRSTTVHPYGDLTLPPIELGASVFVDANLNLMRAVSEFGHRLVPWASGDEDDSLTIWDGTSFLFTTSGGLGWWDKAKLLWRYGYASPTRTQAAVASLLAKFKDLYDPEWLNKNGAWADVEGLSKGVGFDGLAGETTKEWFEEEVKTSERWVEEMVEAASRVNYAQDVTQLHALVGMVSLAATGASSVQGGNWKIFRSFIERSKAKLHLETEVTSISPLLDLSTGSTRWLLHTNSTSTSSPPPAVVEEEPFDALLFANPWHQSKVSQDEGLDGLFGLMDAIPPQPYIHLHVTLLVTTASRPSPSFFNQPPSTPIPRTILTSSATHRHTGSRLPEFQSITYHGEVVEGSEEWVVKIFSYERRGDEWLRELFGEGEVVWVERKEWDAYPKLPPTSTYPPIMPLGNTTSFYYLAALEPWISTMETQTLSARNSVGLLAKTWWNLDMGVCDGIVEGGWDWSC
ncbi:Prenylcysteine lyase-domain-containing protein [Mrakia frigida]|uniref:Prenylcysteine lyase-domain-containing protein n=1 Tax=Mrakia frigida TaxID=29902 RepID=UPI003FCC10EF